MVKYSIQEEMMEILRKVNIDGTFDLQDAEIEKLITMVLAVAKSSLNIRLFFYSEVSKVMQEVQERLQKEHEILLNEILGKKKNKIIN